MSFELLIASPSRVQFTLGVGTPATPAWNLAISPCAISTASNCSVKDGADASLCTMSSATQEDFPALLVTWQIKSPPSSSITSGIRNEMSFFCAPGVIVWSVRDVDQSPEPFYFHVATADACFKKGFSSDDRCHIGNGLQKPRFFGRLGHVYRYSHSGKFVRAVPIFSF